MLISLSEKLGYLLIFLINNSITPNNLVFSISFKVIKSIKYVTFLTFSQRTLFSQSYNNLEYILMLYSLYFQSFYFHFVKLCI